MDYLLAAAATEMTLIRACCVLTGDSQFTVIETTKQVHLNTYDVWLIQSEVSGLLDPVAK